MIAVAPSSSGKTTRIVELLTEKRFGLKQTFGKNVFVFSATSHLDPKWKKVKKAQHKGTNVLGVIPELFAEQEKWHEAMEKRPDLKLQMTNVLLVFDDMISTIDRMRDGEASNLLLKLFTMGRHFGFSIILTTQSLKRCPKVLREQASHWLLFRALNRGQLKEFAEEFGRIELEELQAIHDSLGRWDFLFAVQGESTIYKGWKESALFTITQ